GHSRGRESSLLRRHRRRRCRDPRRRRRSTAAQRVRAADCVPAPVRHQRDAQCMRRVARAVRRGHHGESGPAPLLRRALDRRRHRARARDRLRAGDADREGGVGQRTRRLRRGAREGTADPTGARPLAESRGDDRRQGAGDAKDAIMPRRRKRLDPALFRLAVDEIRQGFYTDKYFERSREILRADSHSPRVLMQVSGKTAGFLSGVDEAIAILKLCSDDWSALAVNALYEGDEFEAWDTVLTIEGPYECFAHLETLYLGVLGRRTRICTNTRRLVEAARPKPVLFFGARQDYWGAQPGDGYAAQAGGASSVSTDAQASLFGGAGVGTVPHSLIAAYGGSTVRASQAFAAHCSGVDLIALVDY